jgi:RNA polymerase sigma factor (sigma-70 family)
MASSPDVSGPQLGVVTPPEGAAAQPSTVYAQLVQLGIRCQEAWEELERRYRRRMTDWCREAGVTNQADLEDATSEAWLKIVGGIGAFDRSRGHFRAWCRTVTANAARDLLKKWDHRRLQGTGDSAVRDQLDQAVGRERDPADQVAQDMDAHYEWVLAQEALARVALRANARTMEVFRRTYLAGESDEVVAADLGLSVEAVQQARSRTIARLRLEIERLNGQGPDPKETVP